jgi:CheY-like chemotaxis protein
MTEAAKPKRVLFVDDDPSFLDLVSRFMTSLSEGGWQVLVAESVSEALGYLKEGSVDLVAIDVQMPVVDGLQFLGLLNRRYPDLTKVVLTGFTTEAYRAACLSNGAELFLQKPMTMQEHKGLYDALQQVMALRSEEGFRGVLRRVGLPDVIQMECLSASSAVLEVTTAGGVGQIYLAEGAIVHARIGDRAGEEAFHFLLGLRGGEFRVESFREPEQRTIDAPWEFLLMEAARKRDEGAMPEGEAITEEDARLMPGMADVEQPFGDVAAATVEQAEGLLRRIEEVLVCSSEGEVLRGWKVQSPERWVNFVEFLSQKARSIGRGLPLGALERFEAAGEDERLLALLREDHAVLIRCREEAG